MRLRISILIFAVAFLIGCSGGGSSQVAGGGTPAPAPGPQSKTKVTMKVDLGAQGREIQASGLPFVLVVAEVVDRSQSDPGTLSKRVVVASGQATVSPDDSSVLISMEVPPGNWDVYVFGIDETGAATGTSPQQLAINGAEVISLLFNLSGGSPTVIVSSVQTLFNVAGNTVTVGDPNLQFSANVFFTDGSSLTNVTGATFVSSDPTVLQVDPNTGVAQALAAGTATVQATYQGVQDPSGVTVTVNAVVAPPRLVSLVSGADTLNSFSYDNVTGSVGAMQDTVSILSTPPGQRLGSGKGATLDTVFFDSGSTVQTFTVDGGGIFTARNPVGTLGNAFDLQGNGPHFYVASNPGGPNDAVEGFDFDSALNQFTTLGSAATPDNLRSIGVSTLPVVYLAAHAGRTVLAMGLNGTGGPTGVALGPILQPSSVSALPTVVRAVPGNNFILVGSSDTVNAEFDSFQTDPTTGALIGIAAIDSLPLPTVLNLAVTPDGRFAYLLTTDFTTYQIDVYSMDPTNAFSVTFTGFSFLTWNVPTNITDLDIDPSGNFLFATNNGTGELVRLTINQVDGSLSAPTVQPSASTTGLFQVQFLP